MNDTSFNYKIFPIHLCQFCFCAIISKRKEYFNNFRVSDTNTRKVSRRMYVKNKNPIALRSQRMLSNALCRLMHRKHFSSITITEICREADVGRKTFYRNFEWKEDVIEFQLDELYREYAEEIGKIELTDYLHHHFDFLERHKDYLILLYKNGLRSLTTERFTQLLPQIMPVWSEDPLEQKFRSAYIVAGINAITTVWAENDFRQTVAEVTAIAQRAQDRQMPLYW